MLAIVGTLIAFAAAICAVRLRTWNEGKTEHWWKRPTTVGWVAAGAAMAGFLLSIGAVIQQKSEARQEEALAAILTKLNQVFPQPDGQAAVQQAGEVIHQSPKSANRRTGNGGARKTTTAAYQEM